VSDHTVTSITLAPGSRQGQVEIPWSKSHLHRLLIAGFLADGCDHYAGLSVSDDVQATRHCLQALQGNSAVPELPCGESGSTLRFLLPVVLALKEQAVFTAQGRLPQRPLKPFLDLLRQHGLQETNGAFPLHLRGRLQPGDFSLPGNISSQIVSGLLFALPLLDGDSTIQLTTPLESRGYVDMTLAVLRNFGLDIRKRNDGFLIPGHQQYRRRAGIAPERDWSAAAFWLAMNSLGSQIAVPGLDDNSCQPDKAVTRLLCQLGGAIDVSQCPDIFPVLAVTAGATEAVTVFRGTRRLRFKESDRLAATADILQRYGVRAEIADDNFTVHGLGPHFRGNINIDPFGDHRIAMAAAVGATVADGPVTIIHPDCASKSYPRFFRQFLDLAMRT